MSDHLTNEAYRQSVRRQIVSTAQAMLNGELSFLLGSRRLAALRFEIDAADDADFLAFVTIDSESDEFPLGAVRHHWDGDALARLEPEIQQAETWAAEVGTAACISLIARFAERED